MPVAECVHGVCVPCIYPHRRNTQSTFSVLTHPCCHVWRARVFLYPLAFTLFAGLFFTLLRRMTCLLCN